MAGDDGLITGHSYYIDAIAALRHPGVPVAGPGVAAAIRDALLHLQDGQPARADACLARYLPQVTGREAAALLAYRCLVGVAGGDLDGAQAAVRAAIELMPDSAPLAGMAGGIALRRRDPAAAVAAYRHAVALDPGHGPAWAALAVIAAMRGDWPAVLEPAGRALAAGSEVGSGLVALSALFGAFFTGQVPAGVDLGALARDAPSPAMAALPALMWHEQADLHPHIPVVFAACDTAYLLGHAAAMVLSLERLGRPANVHLHLYDPDQSSRVCLARLRDCLAHVRLTVTSEVISPPFVRGNVYYSCARYCRAYQVFEKIDRPLVVVDADVLFRRPPEDLPALADPAADIGVVEAAINPPWDRLLGYCVAFKQTEAARRFAGRVADMLATNLAAGAGFWFLDQVALFLAREVDEQPDRFLAMEAARSCSMLHEEGAVMWAVTLGKDGQGAYNDLKANVLGRHAQWLRSL